MIRGQSGIFGQLKELRKELADKQDKIREDLAGAGGDPKRLPPHKRRTFSDGGLGLRLLDDLEAQIVAGGITTDDLPATLGHLIGMLKQLQTVALPGNATPLHGSPVSGPPTPPPAPALRSGVKPGR
jgi:hypothetical protein